MNNQGKALNTNNEARRRLLKMAAYIPPAMLGVMSSVSISNAGPPVIPGQPKVCKGGGTIIVSAAGNACCPCVPTDPKYDPLKCTRKQCKLGNCPACQVTIFKKLKDCNKKAAVQGGCCVCTKVPDPLNPKKTIVKCL